MVKPPGGNSAARMLSLQVQTMSWHQAASEPYIRLIRTETGQSGAALSGCVHSTKPNNRSGGSRANGCLRTSPTDQAPIAGHRFLEKTSRPPKPFSRNQAEEMISLRLSTAVYRAPSLIAYCCPPRLHRLPHTGLCAGMPSKRFGSEIFRLLGRQSFVSHAPPVPELLPPGTPVDEERVPGYNPEHYYPANPGDVLENRYQLDAKIGWGSSSTVWLAHDIHR